MDLIGKKIGDYRIRSEIGRGGMGIVYEAVQESLQRVVALKVLPPQLALEQQFVERFKREAAAIARLEHRNIVRLIDHIEQDNLYCIVMEFVRGQSVKSLISGRPLALDFCVRVGMQVAEALAYAHEQGIIHRDIKPENIMICEGETVKVMDFGIAKVGGSGFQTKTGLAVGTPEYMSPEQARGDKNLDARTDIYSLGVVLYEIITGTPPFSGEPFSVAYKHVHEEPEPPRARNPRVPERLSNLILKCLKKDRNERFQSARELLTELYAVAMAEGISVEKGTLILQRERAGESFEAAKEAYAAGDTERAARLLRKALVLDPDNVEAKALLDEIKGKAEERRRAQQEAARLLAQAKEALAAENLEQARDLAARSLELVPGVEEAQTVLDEAQSRIAALELQRRQAEVAKHLSAAQEAFGGGESARAYEEAQAVLALEPNNAAAQQIVDAIRAERARARGRLVLRAAGVAVVLAVVGGGVLFGGRMKERMATAALSEELEARLGERDALRSRLETSGLVSLPDVASALAALDEALFRAGAALAQGDAEEARAHMAAAAQHLARAEDAASRTLADDSKAMEAALASAGSSLEGLDAEIADLSAVADLGDLEAKYAETRALLEQARSLGAAGRIAEARSKAEAARTAAAAVAARVRSAREEALGALRARRDELAEARGELAASAAAVAAMGGEAAEPAALGAALAAAEEALAEGRLADAASRLAAAESTLGAWRGRVTAALEQGRDALTRLAADLSRRADAARSQAQALAAGGYRVDGLAQLDAVSVDLGLAQDSLKAGVGLDSAAAALQRVEAAVKALEGSVASALEAAKADASRKVSAARELLAKAGEADPSRKDEFAGEARRLGDALVAARTYEEISKVAAEADESAARTGELLKGLEAALAQRREQTRAMLAEAEEAVAEAGRLRPTVPADSGGRADRLLERARASLSEATSAFSEGRYEAAAAKAATEAAGSMKELASGDAAGYARGVAAFEAGDYAAAAAAFAEVSPGYRNAAEYREVARFNADVMAFNEALARMKATGGAEGVGEMERLRDEFAALSDSPVAAVAEAARGLRSVCVQLVGNKGQLLQAVLRLTSPASVLPAPE